MIPQVQRTRYEALAHVYEARTGLPAPALGQSTLDAFNAMQAMLSRLTRREGIRLTEGPGTVATPKPQPERIIPPSAHPMIYRARPGGR